MSHSGTQLIKVPFMEPEVQVCHSQETTTGLYQEPDELRPHSHILLFFRRVHKIAKSDYWFCHVRPSVRMELGSHWTDFFLEI